MVLYIYIERERESNIKYPILRKENIQSKDESPAGSGDGAVNKRSISEVQGAGDTRIILPGIYWD